MPTSRPLQTIVSGEEASISLHSSDLEIMFGESGSSSVASSSTGDGTSSGEESSDLEESVASDLTIGALRRKLRGLDSKGTNLSSVAESEYSSSSEEEDYYDESLYDEESNIDTIDRSEIESKDTYSTSRSYRRGSSNRRSSSRTRPRRTRRSVRRGSSSSPVRSATADPHHSRGGGRTHNEVSRRYYQRQPSSSDEDEEETIVELEGCESQEDVSALASRRSYQIRGDNRKASGREKAVVAADWDDTDTSSKLSIPDRRQRHSGGRRMPAEQEGRLRHVKYVPAMDIATRSLHRDISTVEPLSRQEASDAFFREVPLAVRVNNDAGHDDDVSSIGGFASVNPVKASVTPSYTRVPSRKPSNANHEARRVSSHTKGTKQRERRGHSHHHHEKETTKVQAKEDNSHHQRDRNSHRHHHHQDKEEIQYEAIKVLAKVQQHIDDHHIQEKQIEEEGEEALEGEEDVWIDEESSKSRGDNSNRSGYEKPIQQNQQQQPKYIRPSTVKKKETEMAVPVIKDSDSNASSGDLCCGLRRRSQMELFFIAIISFSVIALIILVSIVVTKS